MEGNKDLISGIKTFWGIVLLIAVLFIVMQLSPNHSLGHNISGPPITSKATFQAYPPPQENNITAQTETTSYPYPILEESINKAQTSDCRAAGTWVEYVNKIADFSFYYPTEAMIFESVDNNEYPSVTLFVKPYCYVKECWGPKQIEISVLTNSDKLSLKEFVVKQYSFDKSTDSLALSLELESISTTISVDNITALQVNGKITREAPRVYIPYNNLVIFMGLVETSNMPPYEPACPTTLNMYNKILSTMKFLNH